MSGKLVEGADVSLFSSQEDLVDKTNLIRETKSNSEGTALFDNLEETIYFFHVKMDVQNNLFGIVSYENPLKEGEKKIIKVTIK